MARTSPLERSATEHMSSPARRAAAARMSGSFCTGTAMFGLSIIALLATVVSSCGLCRALCRGVFCKDFVECLDGCVHVGALQNIRRQETQHGVAGAVDQDVPLEHLSHGELGEVSGIKLRGNHQALASHVHDRVVSRCERTQLKLEVITDLGCVSKQPVFLDGLDDCDSNCTSQRASAKCCAMHPWMEAARNFLSAEQRADGNAARKRLGQRGYIGLDAVVLVGAPLTGAAHAGLNLIDDK